MGRKAAPLAPATAGRKRKGPSFSPLAGAAFKRRRTPAPAQVTGWASLPTDITGLVASRVLAGDVVDYIAFRGVCSDWRAGTPSPCDPTLRDPDLRPRGWIALCDGDEVPPDETCEVTLFHTPTARRLRVHLPELRRHRIVGFTDGLFVLLHKRTAAVRVLHPFTRVVIDLPPLAAAFHQVVKDRKLNSLLNTTAFVCSASATSIAVVIQFPWTTVMLCAQPGHPGWKTIHHGLELWNILPFRGGLYATLRRSGRVVQLYPPTPQRVVAAYAPNASCKSPMWCNFLVESAGRMLLVVQHESTKFHPDFLHPKLMLNFIFTPMEVDLCHRKLIPVSGLGDHSLFLATDRCVSVSSKVHPCILSNSIYFSIPADPVAVYSLRSSVTELLAAPSQIHDTKDRIRPSVRPFTLADHIRTYCHHFQWARGLMFHEYHTVPESFEELQKKLKVQDSQVRIPRVGVGSEEGKN